MKIYITSDHGGFELKSKLVNFLQDNNFTVEDLGPFTYDADDDYPVFAKRIAEKVSKEIDTMGIIACRSATGVSITANRQPGVRAAIAWNETVAKHSREHNDSNILCLSGDYVQDEDNLKVALAWAKEPFSEEPRHKRRIDMIDN